MQNNEIPRRYRAGELRVFARTLLERAGVRDDIARDIADVVTVGA